LSFVVDSSIAVKWFLPEAWHDEALQILNREDAIYAPDLIVAEVANVAWKKALRGEVIERQALDIVAGISSGVPILCPSSLLSEAALKMGLAINHPVYDCLYMACAEYFGSYVITDDQRLCRAVIGTIYAPLVVHISNV
jgi:predicted nucleic acid-binding protein